MTLPRPRFGTLATISYDKSKSGSVPFDPDKLKAYDMRSFRRRYTSYQGSDQIIQNFVGPVVHDRPLFMEADDQIDLFNKVYMPLSQAVRQHGVQFSMACETHHMEGTEDHGSVCTSVHTHRISMIMEEKSQNMFGHLYTTNIRASAIEGRNLNMAGIREGVASSNFQSALAVAQILGDMAQRRVVHGVIVTASRAFFILIVPRASNKRPRSPDGPNLLDGTPQFPDSNGMALPDERMDTLLENSDPGIYVSSAVMVDDPAYLRIMAGFMVESYEFRSGGSYLRWMAELTTLLVTPGGLSTLCCLLKKNKLLKSYFSYT
jgi:hypothetical protein